MKNWGQHQQAAIFHPTPSIMMTHILHIFGVIFIVDFNNGNKILDILFDHPVIDCIFERK
jgi:hypothetical protein